MDELHFRDSQLTRGIYMRSILEVLRRGQPVGAPEMGEYGDRRIKMRRKVAGRRIHVVAAVCADHVEFIPAW